MALPPNDSGRSRVVANGGDASRTQAHTSEPRELHVGPIGDGSSGSGEPTMAEQQATVAEQQGQASADTGTRSGEGSAEQKVEALEDQLRRALADLENLRKRFEREVAREREAERVRVTEQWLPVVDDLERALEHASVDPGAVISGIRAVRDRALAVLERSGYPRFEDLGEQFDPTRHEALGTVDTDAPAGTVVSVARPGYGKDGTVLRPAGVVVSRGPS